ncbi:MAG: hypothetical protein ACPGUV_14480 [Polyangiales bacterium]
MTQPDAFFLSPRPQLQRLRAARPNSASQRPRVFARICGMATLCTLVACQHQMIPNTDVLDSPENREVVSFVEQYRKAVEARDVVVLLSLVSPRYYDDNGTPSAEDDMDFGKLREQLLAWQQTVEDVRYEIRYRRIQFQQDKVLVDYTYTGSFKLKVTDASRWARRLADNRLVLRRAPGDDHFRILSGM